MSYEDTPNDQEPEEVYVKCLLCGETVEADWYDTHASSECDMVGWEEL